MKERILAIGIGFLIGVLLSSLYFVGIHFSKFFKPKQVSVEYSEFQKKYGSKQRFFCNEDEFLMEQYFAKDDDNVSTLRLVLNGGDSPVHCVYFNKKNKKD